MSVNRASNHFKYDATDSCSIRPLMEKQDRKAFKKISQLCTHPLRETKVINYNLHNKNSARTLINTERFKNIFNNRL